MKNNFALFVLAALFLSALPAHASYADRDVHDSGEIRYKHNRQSYTGPFDYAPVGGPAAPQPKKAGQCNEFTFDATKSFDVDRQKLSVHWDLGDGTESDKAVVTHAYEKAGEYKVRLTVRDDSGQVCDSGIAETRVFANFPPTAAAGEDRASCVGETVRFDASGSKTSNDDASYVWDFGDGTKAEGQSVTHVYEKPGRYNARLLVDDLRKTECSVAGDSVTVDVAEVVGVELQGPEASCAGQTVHFSAPGSGGSLKYRWDFGDGEEWQGGSRASHTYKKGGNYNVRVTADNSRGSACSSASDSLAIRVGQRPTADAGENLVCCVGKENTFDASGSTGADDLTYRWDFGDGNGAEGKVVKHTYEKSGNYRVVLTVSSETAGDCGSAMDSFVAEVNTNPQAVIQVR